MFLPNWPPQYPPKKPSVARATRPSWVKGKPPLALVQSRQQSVPVEPVSWADDHAQPVTYSPPAVRFGGADATLGNRRCHWLVPPQSARQLVSA
jgi:hypothetical protein